VSVQQYAAPINKVPGVIGVQVNDDAKTAVVTYTGELRGLLDVGAAAGSHGGIVDPAPVSAGIISTPDGFCVHDLNEALRPVPGIRQIIPGRGGFDLSVNMRELDVEKLLTQKFKFAVLSHEFFDLSSASPLEPEQWTKLRNLLDETKGVLRATVTDKGVQVIAGKGKLTADALRKIAERAQMQVKVTPRK
jgi:hypothetical protein